MREFLAKHRLSIAIASKLCLSLFLLCVANSSAYADYYQHCSTGTSCDDMGCTSTTACEIYYIPGGSGDSDFVGPPPPSGPGDDGGVGVGSEELASAQDADRDGNMDCWKGITQEARLTSGYPLRNDNLTEHSGVDIASDYGNYGDGSNIRSLTSGKVLESGKSYANGTYIRVKDSKGDVFTYIHMKSLRGLADGTLVASGSLLGTMNCSGNCGEGALRGDITKTHVHVTRYTNWPSKTETADPRENTGGESCGS